MDCGEGDRGSAYLNLVYMDTKFAPELKVRVVAPALEFYKQAFGVVELKRYSNDDGSIHVAELMLGGAEFYLHEEMPGNQGHSPESVKGTTVELVVFVPDPDALMARALAAGGKEVHPMQDHFYGLRQGTVRDPFGHLWTLQKRIPEFEGSEG